MVTRKVGREATGATVMAGRVTWITPWDRPAPHLLPEASVSTVAYPGGSAVGTPFQVVTVLVVDDVRLARQIAVRILSEEGYRVLEADGADEALEVLSEARGRVDLVLVDVVMPNGDGVVLTKSLREEWPDQRLLYMSAHPAEILARHGLKDLNVPFLAKPYTRTELLAKVKSALRHHGESGSLVERRKRGRFKGK
jgi:DNA-binding response OmpR family regulator